MLKRCMRMYRKKVLLGVLLHEIFHLRLAIRDGVVAQRIRRAARNPSPEIITCLWPHFRTCLFNPGGEHFSENICSQSKQMPLPDENVLLRILKMTLMRM